jgi:hypothetical protein
MVRSLENLPLRHVVAVPGDGLAVLDQLVADRLLGASGAHRDVGHAVDHVADQLLDPKP